MFVDFGRKDEFSIKNAMGNTKSIVSLLKERNQTHYAVSNYGDISNWVQQMQVCKKNGIIPILGMETFVNNYRIVDKENYKVENLLMQETKDLSQMTDEEKDLVTIDFSIDLFAKDEAGYYNIIQIHNDAQLYGVDKRPRTSDHFLKDHGKGIVALFPTPYSEISSLIYNGMEKEALEKYEFYKNIFDDIYLEITMLDDDEYKEINDGMILFCKKYGIKMVPVCNSHYIYQEEEDTFDTIKKLGKMRGGMSYEVDVCKSMYYRSKEDVILLFRNKFESKIFTKEIFDELMKNLDELVLTFRYLEIDTSPKLPKFKDGERLLREKTIEGFERLGYDKKGIEYKNRLEYELDNIIRVGFADYFLLLEDVFRWYIFEKKCIPAIGRGSASGSLVLNCLGVTNIDPIKNKLLFERFLDASRLDEIINKGGKVDGCFTRDTIVRLNNDYRGIESVKVGSEVISRDNTKRVVNHVKSLGIGNFYRMIYRYNGDDYYLDVTKEHVFPFVNLSESGEKEICDFDFSKDLLIIDEESEEYAEIISFDYIGQFEKYDLEVEGLHYYRVCGRKIKGEK